MEIIFPENLKCISCDDHISINNPYSMCKSCYDKLEKDMNICIRCGRILGATGICFECERENYYFDKVYSVFRYNDVLHNMVHIFKYGQGTYMAKPLGLMMSDYIQKYNIDFEYILFVPLGKKRYRERGYNQSKLLAEEIAKNLKIPIVECFQRIKNTNFLAKLTGIQRKKEIENAFEIINKTQLSVLAEKKILIIDDIFTTGFTANELSRILKKFIFVEEISILTLGNAKSKKDL